MLMFKDILAREKIEKAKRELAEMNLGPLYVDMDFIDPDTDKLIANAGEVVPPADVDRVLYLALVDDRSEYFLLDNGIIYATGYGPES